MAKLSKAEAKAHAAACDLLKKDRLTLDEKEFVLRNWQAGGTHVNTLTGAFFTPLDLAYDFRLEVCGGEVIDLCAGIGALSFAKYHASHPSNSERMPRITCIEINPDYVAVGRKLLPEAEWICADVFNLPATILARRWQVAMSNPPFGAAPRTGTGPRYTGRNFDLHVIDIASQLAEFGAFIIPQGNGPFEFSGRQCYRQRETEASRQFYQQTGIELAAGCGIDAAYHRDGWHGVAPNVEIVCCEFAAQPRQAAPTAALALSSELTAIGEQFVIPGCERRPAAKGKAAQLDLWDAAVKVAAE